MTKTHTGPRISLCHAHDEHCHQSASRCDTSPVFCKQRAGGRDAEEKKA